MDRRQCPKCNRKYGPDYPHERCGGCGSKLRSLQAMAERGVKRIQSKRRVAA